MVAICLGQEPFLEVEDCVAMPYPDSLVCQTHSNPQQPPHERLLLFVLGFGTLLLRCGSMLTCAP